MGVFWSIRGKYKGGGGTHAEVCLAEALLKLGFCVRYSPVSWLCVFEARYHGMVSEGLFSIYPRLQMHCIVNVYICLKDPDDKTIDFCMSLQILT